MRVLFTICGRAGSKGLKNKNISNLLGKPLVYYTISAIDLFVKNQKVISDLQYDIALNTDSKKLKEIVSSNSMQKVEIIDRKEELAGDIVAKKDVIADTYIQMKKNKYCEYDVVVDLDITSPLRREIDIENLLLKYIESNVDVVFSVVKSRRNPYFNMVCIKDGIIKKVIDSNFTTRQQAPEIYDMNASLYAYSINFLLSSNNILDGKSDIIIMNDTMVLDLDDKEDSEYMNVIANYLFLNDKMYSAVFDNIA